jgi:TPR repeat protein
MNRTIKTVGVALILVTGIAGSAPAGPAEDGAAAYKRGDYVTAMRFLRPLAHQGNADAQFLLGAIYGRGEGVEQDYTTAVTWYRKAADQGHPGAQWALGTMYQDGLGDVPRAFEAAASWYRKAADQGLALAQYDLGTMYAKGQGVPQDYVSALMWYSLAAAKGLTDAAKERDMVAAQMTPAQIAEAQRLAREWKPRQK